VSFEEGRKLLKNDINAFKKKVDESLIAHYELIKKMSASGTFSGIMATVS